MPSQVCHLVHRVINLMDDEPSWRVLLGPAHGAKAHDVRPAETSPLCKNLNESHESACLACNVIMLRHFRHVIVTILNFKWLKLFHIKMIKRFFKRPYKDKDLNSVSSRDSLEIKDLLDDSGNSVNGDDFGYLTLHKSRSSDIAPDVVQTEGEIPSTVEADLGFVCVPCLNIATEKMYDAKRKELNSLLKKYKKKEHLVTQKQKEVMMMETEVRELMRLCKILEDQTSALEEDVQNKKCEMNAFGSLVTGNAETEVKKREPLYYKKYNNVKNANEAKHLLSIIRHKANALRHLEIMTYQKLLDFQYQLKSEAVKQKTIIVKKDSFKRRNFEFVFDAIRSRFERQTVMGSVSEDQAADKEVETTNPFSFIQSNETNSRSTSPITVSAPGFVLHPLESSL